MSNKVYIGASADTILNVSSSWERAKQVNLEFLEENEELLRTGELKKLIPIRIEVWKLDGSSSPIEAIYFSSSEALKAYKKPFYAVLINGHPFYTKGDKNHTFVSWDEAFSYLQKNLGVYSPPKKLNIGENYFVPNANLMSDCYQIVRIFLPEKEQNG